MCRSSHDAHGARRCNKNNNYGKKIRNLQAQKQYYAKKGDMSRVEAISDEMSSLREEKQALIADGGKLLPYTMNLTPNAIKVLNQLRESGLTPYVVGGSVRDALMGADSKDVDIEVYGGTPEAVVKSLRKIGQVDEVGKSFGVLKIRIGSEDFDVSLPRRDSKAGNGHKGFTVTVDADMSLAEATARRDFTINALMYDDKTGHIIDKHGGLEDLHEGYLRHVSDAFDEDPLRVLRGVQMASRFNMRLHPETITKAETLKDEFSSLPIERVQVEFEKLYTKGKAPDKAIQLLQDTGWDKNFPGLQTMNLKNLKRDLRRTQQLVDAKIIPKERVQLVLSAVMASRMSDKDAREFLRYTTIGDTMKNGAYALSRLQLPVKQGKAGLRAWAKAMPNKLTINDWTMLEQARGNKEKASQIKAKAEKLGILHAPEPDIINGHDLLTMKEGSKPGPWVAQALNKLRAAQYADTFRTREAGLEWAAKNI